MSFEKYGEIENTYSSKLPEKALLAGLGGVECICAVKVDGANFQAGIGADGVFFTGTRNRELKPDEDFCGWQRVMAKLDVERKLREVKAMLGCSEVIMYGELCGGLYRHPDVPQVREAVRIQGRVDYSPDNEWVPFDLKADGKYVSQDLLQKLCSDVGLPCQQVVFRGTLEECLKFDPVMQDTTGQHFWGLPPIDGNVAEGVVVKPVEAVYLGCSRVIFKIKTPKFKERIRRTKAVIADAGLTDVEKSIVERALEYVNEARVFSALSKLGTSVKFSQLTGEVIRDAMADFRKEAGGELEKLERTADPKEINWKKIGQRLSRETSEVVRPVFLRECVGQNA